MVLAGVVELFEHYPAQIVARAVSPVFGLPRRHKFVPRIAEIAEFLEEEMVPIRREEERQARPLMLPEPPIDRSTRLSYAELCSKYGGDGKGNWGIPPEKSRPDPFPSVAQLKQMAGDEWHEIKNQPVNWKKVV